MVFGEHRSADLVAEALPLATEWGLANLEPDTVIVLLAEGETADLDALEAAGFRHDGPVGAVGGRPHPLPVRPEQAG